MSRRNLTVAALVALTALLGAGAARTAAAAEPRLVVSLVADRMVVEPGGLVRYAVHVVNAGDATAQHVRVTSHLPARTSAATEQCPEGVMEPDGDICIQPEVATPGLGVPHQVVHSRSPLLPGERLTLLFAVRVDDDAPPGTVLSNHAHAAADSGPEVTSGVTDTLVIDRDPNAAFGLASSTLAGGSVTDSFDSELGSYAQTAQLASGNVASNGPILVTGGSTVNGDATPGPGSVTTVSNNSTVTGSTAPAATPVMTQAVDAGSHALSNANERFCAVPGTCASVTFDPAAASLSVEGSAVLEPGAYFLCRLDVTGTLTVVGPTAVWIGGTDRCGSGGGTARFAAHAVVDVTTGLSRDFQLRLEGGPSASTTVTGDSAFAGVVYGPASALVLDGGSEVFGGFTSGSIVAGAGGGSLHVDRGLFSE